jgi:hypothetical protein
MPAIADVLVLGNELQAYTVSTPEIKVTGRVLTLSKSTLARNQHFGEESVPAARPASDSPGGPISANDALLPPRRIRQDTKPLLNKLEMEWYHVLKRSYGPDVPVFSQAIRFRLGNGIWYKPDFMVFGTPQFYGYEVKGPHAFRGGFENLKVCVNLYREIKWYLVWKLDGQWEEQEVLP